MCYNTKCRSGEQHSELPSGSGSTFRGDGHMVQHPFSKNCMNPCTHTQARPPELRLARFQRPLPFLVGVLRRANSPFWSLQGGMGRRAGRPWRGSQEPDGESAQLQLRVRRLQLHVSHIS